jgi:hypothetical protein
MLEMEMTDLLAPEDRAALEREADTSADALTELRALEIQTQEDLTFAGDFLVAVKARWKELEAKRTAITRPILDAKRKVDELFQPVLAPLAAAESVLRQKIGAYTVERERAAGEAMRALTPIAPPEPPKGISVKSAWDFVIEDESLVPREFWSVDPEKIRAAIGYADTIHVLPYPIPGVKFLLRGRVMVRT